MDQNNKNKPNKPGGNKPGGSNWRGVISLLCWAVILTAIISYAGTYMTSAGHSSSSVELVYGDFLDMVEAGQVDSVAFDNDESILVITPRDGYTYTDSQGTVYTKTGADDRGNVLYTYDNPIGQEQQTTLRFFTVQKESNDATIARLEDADIQIITEYEPPMSTLMVILLNILPFIIILLVMSLLMSWMAKKGGMGGIGGIGGVGKANAKVYMEKSTGVTFGDVAGQDEAKESLTEIIDFLHNPGKYTEIGAKLPKGALLVGPPGTGKTLLAKAVAGEAGVGFLSISGSDFVELYVGVGASRVRDLFEQAKKTSPCIVFIDEIDAVGRQRGTGLGGGHDEREQTLNQLLVEMDGFAANEGVVVLAATNRSDVLDPALLRPGRFDRQIYVGLPDIKGRQAILKVHAKGKPLAEDVDLRKLAQGTAGFTGADLENLINEGALLAARKERSFITMDDLRQAEIKVIAGPEKKSRVIPQHERELTAYHEAGHAVVMHALPGQDPVSQITIVPRGQAGGMTISLPEEDRSYLSKKYMEDEIVSLLGGRVAEQLCLGDISTGASNDIQRATAIARKMVASYGMSERLGTVSFESGHDEVFLGRSMGQGRGYSEAVAAQIDEEVRCLIDGAYRRCTALLTQRRDQLERVAQYLLEHETMERDVFLTVAEGREASNETTRA